MQISIMNYVATMCIAKIVVAIMLVGHMHNHLRLDASIPFP